MQPISPRFRFQRFAIDDSSCGMKIGTDAVLLGAWADVTACQQILDIGTGCGIIAMMLAQRTETTRSQIVAIEPEPDAAQTAASNFSACPWPDRISIRNTSLQNFSRHSASHEFDLCVCNPPFFTNSTRSTETKKRSARHTDELSRQQLFDSVNLLLKLTGCFCLILPFDQINETIPVASVAGFHLSRQLRVRPQPNQEFKRVLMKFTRQAGTVQSDELTIENRRHEFSADYEALTRNFHLRFAKPEQSRAPQQNQPADTS